MNAETTHAPPDFGELRREFLEFFTGNDGRFSLKGNVGRGRMVNACVRQALEQTEPFLYDTLLGWDDEKEPTLKDENGNQVTVLAACRILRQLGLWEAAWGLAQLHFVQTQMMEVKKGRRFHKGHPACGIAILGREIDSPALTRHYAQVSSAGDVYVEHDPEHVHLHYGGYGATMLEQFESGMVQDAWRNRIRPYLGGSTTREPKYLEAFVAARWFGDAHAKAIFDNANVACHQGKPFAEVQLDAVENGHEMKGTLFEAAAGLLLSTTPGFEVRPSRQTTDEQTDLVVNYAADRLSRLQLPTGPGLVECKSSRDAIRSPQLREFGAKCMFHRVGFGIMVARAGVTGQATTASGPAANAELVRRRFLVDGLTVLKLEISDLRGKAHELRGLQDVLVKDHEELVFGRISGES